MKVINITFCADSRIVPQLRHIIKHELLPLTADTFAHHKLMRVTSGSEPGVENLALHLTAADHDAADSWMENIGARWLDALVKATDGSVAWFATHLEEIDL